LTVGVQKVPKRVFDTSIAGYVGLDKRKWDGS
jgi:hypothetical protein